MYDFFPFKEIIFSRFDKIKIPAEKILNQLYEISTSRPNKTPKLKKIELKQKVYS